MENTDVFIQAVEGFQDQKDSWNDTLENFIAHIARTGDTLVSWEKARKVFVKKLEMALEEFYRVCPYSPGKINANAENDDFNDMKGRLLLLAGEFDEPPFTIQRLCELLVDPMKNYKKCEKFMRGVEKNLMVVTSWNPPARRKSQGNDSMVNGISFGPSNCLPPSDRVKPHWANLPPSPVATGPPKIPGGPDFTANTSTRDGTQLAGIPEDAAEGSEGGSTTQQKNTEDSSDQKQNVSATIISSSPMITINIKRKLDDALKTDGPSAPQKLVPDSPTKKLKFDEMEEMQPPSKQADGDSNQTPDETIDDSTKPDQNFNELTLDSAKPDTAQEMQTEEPLDKEMADETKEKSTESEPMSDCETKEGTPVDPSKAEVTSIEVD